MVIGFSRSRKHAFVRFRRQCRFYFIFIFLQPAAKFHPSTSCLWDNFFLGFFSVIIRYYSILFTYYYFIFTLKGFRNLLTAVCVHIARLTGFYVTRSRKLNLIALSRPRLSVCCSRTLGACPLALATLPMINGSRNIKIKYINGYIILFSFSPRFISNTQLCVDLTCK